MKSNVCILLALIMAAGFSACKTGSYLETIDGITLVHLRGTPYERGAAHGQMLKEEIHESISKWKQEVESAFERDFEELIDEFFNTTAYLESIESMDPDLLDEIFGMSETSLIEYKILLAFQMSEELFTVLDQEARSNCTSIGIVNAEPSACILGQNMDPPWFLHGHPIVLHNIPGKGKPETLIFSVPGLLGLAGMNDRGVAVTCMGISMLNHSTRGLPVVSVIRRILSMTDLEGAEAFVRQCTFAIPQCFGVGDPGGLRCFECSANQLAEFYPFEGRDVVLHTNHSIENRDFNQGFTELLSHYGKSVDDPYFCPRYFHAYDKIEAYGRSFGRDSLGAILRLPEPELEPILNENTLGTLVMELDDDPRMFLATGHSTDASFVPVTF
jgi:hypothetical protein